LPRANVAPAVPTGSEHLGHTDAGFTLRTYTHLMPNSNDRTKRAVDKVFAGYMGDTSEAL
jgi:integrase